MEVNYNSYYTLRASLNAGERREFQLVIDNDSFFQVEKMTSYHDSVYNALIRDTSLNLAWSNVAIKSDNLFGTAQFPNRLRTKKILPPSSTIFFDLENLDPLNPNEIFITLEGYRLYQPITLPRRTFYVYALNAALPALNIVDTQLRVSNLGDFLVEKHIRYADYEFEVRMSASGLSGRSLTNVLTHGENIFGNALNPNIIEHPYKLIKNSILNVYLKNRQAAVNNVQLCFEGSILLGNEGSSPEII